MLMDVTESLNREREREREREIERVSEKSVCACVKETWTTHDKSREKACVSYANISHMHLQQWKQDEEITGGSCKVNWSAVCTPTSHGGLGITDLERFSRSLRLRWLWIAWSDPGRPWVDMEPPCSNSDKALFAAATTVTIGDGATALF